MATFLVKRYEVLVAVPDDDPDLPQTAKDLDSFPLYLLIEALDNGVVYDYRSEAARAVEVDENEDDWADPYEALDTYEALVSAWRSR